jgi:hypothetical protein
LAIDPQTPAIIYADLRQRCVLYAARREDDYLRRVLKHDGGVSWSAFNNGLTNTVVQALALDPQTPAIIYALTIGNGVFSMQQGEKMIYLPLFLRQ